MLLFARLVMAPMLIVVILIFVILLTVYAGIGWIFTGDAHIQAGWPSWN